MNDYRHKNLKNSAIRGGEWASASTINSKVVFSVCFKRGPYTPFEPSEEKVTEEIRGF
jgi:hypothetical protein